MTATDIDRETTPRTYTGTGTDHQSTTVLAVVGFDGSDPSRAALEAASQLIHGRDGHLEIVYVAHLPGYASMSAQALVGIRDGFTDIAAELSDAARTALGNRDAKWHFQRRDGVVATELVAAATELRHQYGPDPTIVIIVGVSAQLAHHIAGSVAVSLARDAGFPLLIVPVPSDHGTPDPDTTEAAHYLG
jgi:nucleotide-binding universal stress UspA family protein